MEAFIEPFAVTLMRDRDLQLVRNRKLAQNLPVYRAGSEEDEDTFVCSDGASGLFRTPTNAMRPTALTAIRITTCRAGATVTFVLRPCTMVHSRRHSVCAAVDGVLQGWCASWIPMGRLQRQSTATAMRTTTRRSSTRWRSGAS